jgi:hypothetical protein
MQLQSSKELALNSLFQQCKKDLTPFIPRFFFIFYLVQMEQKNLLFSFLLNVTKLNYVTNYELSAFAYKSDELFFLDFQQGQYNEMIAS